MNIRPVSSEMASESQESRLTEMQMQLEEMQETIEQLSELIRLEDDTLTINARTIVIESDTNMTLRSNGNLTVEVAANFQINAANMSVSSSIATYSGMITCQTIQATTVMGTSYTPGAGNVW